MKRWEEEITINAPIDHVWAMLDGSLEDMQKLMPNLTSNELIGEEENKVGSIYRQKFTGKREQTYDVEILEYENRADFKRIKLDFPVANIAQITTTYEVRQEDEATTHFRYITKTKPLKWIMRILLFFSGKKTAVKFVRRVKEISEKS